MRPRRKGAEFISKRTKAALKAAKARESQLGGFRNEAIQRKAREEAERAMKIIGPLRKTGQTLTAIADTMNDMGVKTSRGGKWSATQVMRVLERAA